jgi:hypothetical protein
MTRALPQVALFINAHDGAIRAFPRFAIDDCLEIHMPELPLGRKPAALKTK